MQNVRIGWNLPGTMMRLGLHTGAILGWFYYGLPKPVMAIGSSVGALVLSCMLSFERGEMKRMAGLVANLRRDQIFTPSKGLVQAGYFFLGAGGILVVALLAAGSLGGLWAAGMVALAVLYAVVRIRGTARQQNLLRVFLLLVALATGHFAGSWIAASVFWSGLFAFDRLFKQALHVLFTETRSPLDTGPLFRLLRENLSFRHLFRSPTELRVITTGIAAPRVRVFSTHDPGTNDPEDPIHCDRFVDIIRASTALPGRFPLIYVDGECLRDAEVWTAFPIEEFKDKVDIVFRFDYWAPLEAEPAPEHWLSDLFRSFDVMRDRATAERMDQYELERREDPSLPKVVYLRMSDKLRREVPRLAVYDFKPGQLLSAIRIGYRIIRENHDLIRLELAEAAKRYPAVIE